MVLGVYKALEDRVDHLEWFIRVLRTRGRLSVAVGAHGSQHQASQGDAVLSTRGGE
jgi:hypothetical protein